MPDSNGFWNNIFTFISTETNPWIVTAIIGAITALWAFYKFRYEQKLEKFKEAYTNLFVEDKQQKLSAIATLGVFKRDPLFEKHTIDVLISKLYTETDYDITNAIGNALIQFSNRRELIYIASEVLDINRNFHVQAKPYEFMAADLDKAWGRMQRIRNNFYEYTPGTTEQEQSINKEITNSIRSDKYRLPEKAVITETEQKILKEFTAINSKNLYEVLWGKQITADTYGRIICRAANMQFNWSLVFFDYLYKALILWDFKIYGKRFSVYMYQNTFSYSTLADFKTYKIEILRSALSNAVIADIDFNNVRIYDSNFMSAGVYNCVFNKGTIERSFFTRAIFDTVTFRNIHFEDIFFMNVTLKNCKFENCTGIDAPSFYYAVYDSATFLSFHQELQQQLNNVNLEQLYIDKVRNSKLYDSDKEELLSQISSKPN